MTTTDDESVTQLAAITDVLVSHVVPGEPPATQRNGYDSFGASMRTRDDVSLATTRIGGVACERLTPEAATDTVIVYLHGGGYVIGSPVSHRAFVAELAAASGATVLVPEYRLAPEDPHPAALEDAVAVLTAVVADVGAGRVVLSGDSAGGGLSLATLLALRDRALPQPSLAVLYSPWTDLTFTGETMVTNRDVDTMVSEDLIREMAAYYRGEHDAAHPYISPLLGDMAGLASMCIHVGGHEILLDDSRRVAERVHAAGGEVQLTEWPGMSHIFATFAPLLPDTHPAWSCIAASAEAIRNRAVAAY